MDCWQQVIMCWYQKTPKASKSIASQIMLTPYFIKCGRVMCFELYVKVHRPYHLNNKFSCKCMVPKFSKHQQRHNMWRIPFSTCCHSSRFCISLLYRSLLQQSTLSIQWHKGNSLQTASWKGRWLQMITQITLMLCPYCLVHAHTHACMHAHTHAMQDEITSIEHAVCSEHICQHVSLGIIVTTTPSSEGNNTCKNLLFWNKLLTNGHRWATKNNWACMYKAKAMIIIHSDKLPKPKHY